MSPSPLCGAKTRAGWDCKHERGWGTDHPGYGRCKMHGGNSPSGRTFAVKQQAAASAAKLGDEAPVTAEAALEWTIRLLGGEVAFLQERVRELEDGLMDGGDLHPVARALGGAAERLARVAKLGVDADLEGRRLELDALVIDRIGAAVSGAIADANLDAVGRERLSAALRRRLGELSDGDLRPVRPELAG